MFGSSDMLGLYAVISVILLLALVLCLFVYKLLFGKKKTIVSNFNQPTGKQFSEDQEQEIKYILQEIENASKGELKGIMERGAFLLPNDCKSILQVACEERLIKLGLKARRDSFENREKSIRRQWLVMFVIFYLLLPLKDTYFLWTSQGSEAILVNQWALLLGLFFKPLFLYYFAYIKKGTNWLVFVITVSMIMVSLSVIGFFKIFHETGEIKNTVLFDYFVSLALTLLPVWFCYRLYKINCEAKGRENLKKVNCLN